uniref:Conotoxin superfamily H n=1 Tax=Conus magus TaxID=6492 RepID=A0A5P8I0K1_CONMA|nr:conotoxin superfamily H [Conus magus]
MNTAGRLLLLCLALGLVFESLGIPVADDVKADRDTDPDDEDPRGLNLWEPIQTMCGDKLCDFGCCFTVFGVRKCKPFHCP